MEISPAQPVLRFGPYEADLRAGVLRKDGTKIRVQEKPLQVLAALAERQGEMVTRAELHKHLWPNETFVDFEDGLNTAVKKLRLALSDDAEEPRYIETIPRRGYRFLATAEFSGGGNGSNGAPQAAVPELDTVRTTGPITRPLSAFPAENASQAAAAVVPVGTVPRRWKFWIGATAISLAFVAAVATWLLGQRPAFLFNSKDSVLVADFENDTGDPRFDQALQTAFSVSLEQSRNANVFSRLRLPPVLKRMGRPASTRITPAVGREICQRENIRGLIACSITRTGQEYALTAELIDPRTGATLRSYTERSNGEGNILDALDALSRKIRADLGESLYQIHAADRPLPQVTTKSLAALKDYADGMSLWQQGKFDDAMPLFRSAVAIDPGFAMAHAALGSAYCSYIYNEQALGQQEYEKALALSTRATHRERMIIRTQYADDLNHVDEAASLYRTYLSQYPNDWNMLTSYAHLLRMHGREKEAIAQYQQILRVAPDDATAYVEMATAYDSLGDFQKSLDAYTRAFQLEPQWLTAGNTNREYGFALVEDGQQQKAEQVFTALLAKPETRENGLRSLAFLDLYRGRYASAQRRLEDALTIDANEHQDLSMARVHYMLAVIAGGQGNSRKQIAELDAAMASFQGIGPKVVYGTFVGQEYARAGAIDKAERILSAITPLVDARDNQQTKLIHMLQAEIALAKGNPEKALGLIPPPVPNDDHTTVDLLTESMAHAYQKAGQIGSAVQWYEKVLMIAPTFISWEPQQRSLEARYILAEDYLTQGDREKARTALAPLLKLWTSADTNLPLRHRSLQLEARIAP
ncbi:MAG TPA: tetratricopeptide repeat protein [Candidatus Dormibacteraeota bacterium]|nr:tetratricopeptide repeat protein [Candidatus Dormibacteraeota bacterium]